MHKDLEMVPSIPSKNVVAVVIGIVLIVIFEQSKLIFKLRFPFHHPLTWSFTVSLLE